MNASFQPEADIKNKVKSLFTTEAQRTQRKTLKMVSRACGAANKGIGFSSVFSVPLW